MISTGRRRAGEAAAAPALAASFRFQLKNKIQAEGVKIQIPELEERCSI